MRWLRNRPEVRAGAAFVASMAALLILGGSAHAASGGTLGIAPLDEPAFFHIELIAGGLTRRTAVVSNSSPTPQTILIYPADGLTTPQGGFTVESIEHARLQVGAWTKLPLSTLTLAPHEHRKVSFEVAVPHGTPPGDYSGGVVVQSQPRKGQSTKVGGQTAVQLNFVERVAARVYLHVAGTARSSLRVGALTSRADGAGRRFTLAIANTGNTRLQPHASIVIHGIASSDARVGLSAVDALLPGQSIVLSGRWAHQPRLFWGQATATITSEAGVAHAQGAVHVLPVAFLAIGTVLLIGLAWAALKAVRFVRRARAALGTQPPMAAAPVPVPLPSQPVPPVVGPTRHKHLRR